MKLNPAFKRTQPLPLLTADMTERKGRAARSLAPVLPVTRAWPLAAASAAGQIVKANLNVSAAVAV
ncbi:MAG TPA: hypothetical protein VFZ59_14825 [Verrucomicrobiae bacterium]|nr:hypothetical protein [Verrucomicrobiae bacterium]